MPEKGIMQETSYIYIYIFWLDIRENALDDWRNQGGCLVYPLLLCQVTLSVLRFHGIPRLHAAHGLAHSLMSYRLRHTH